VFLLSSLAGDDGQNSCPAASPHSRDGLESDDDRDSRSGDESGEDSEKENDDVVGSESEESNGESEGENTEGESSASVIEVGRSDKASAEISSDDEEWSRPVLTSTPIPSPKAQHGSAQRNSAEDQFLSTLYDSVVSSGAIVEEGISARATEVGTIEEIDDHLLGAEANRRSGPAYDVRMLNRLMEANQVPQRLPFLCIGAREMRLQSHTDCTPVVLIRYSLTQRAIDVIRLVTLNKYMKP